MNTEKLIAVIKNPSLLDKVEITELETIVSTYPYFVLARVLLTKKMQQSQHLLLKKEIKKTAVSVPNRKLLYEFLYLQNIQKTIIESQEEQETVTEVETSEDNTEGKDAKETTVVPSTFTKNVEIESTTPTSKFSKPINLKDFGTDKANEIDILEQQIIGQTIEHVLSQEIESQHEKLPAKENSSQEGNAGAQKFSDWLAILDRDRLESWRSKEPETNKTEIINESEIINSFLQKDVNIIAPTHDSIDYSPSNLARLSVVDDEDFVTETLADIYAKQGNLPKALSAYKKLLLKYPEKKTYFAARIEKIEKDLK